MIVLPITEDKLLPEYFKQPYWKAIESIKKKNGKTVEASALGATPEIALRRLLKLLNN
jgi:hypothetical protein